MRFIEVDEIGYENALGRGKSLVNIDGIESIRSGQWLYSYSDLQKQ